MWTDVCTPGSTAYRNSGARRLSAGVFSFADDRLSFQKEDSMMFTVSFPAKQMAFEAPLSVYDAAREADIPGSGIPVSS